MTEKELEADFEITFEAFKHLLSLTAEFTENINSLYTTYPHLGAFFSIAVLGRGMEEDERLVLLQGKRSVLKNSLKEEYDELVTEE